MQTHRTRYWFLFQSAVSLFIPAVAFGQSPDAATVLSRSGSIIQLESGYRQLVREFAGRRDRVVTVTNGSGGEIATHLGDVAALCRGDCERSLKRGTEIQPPAPGGAGTSAGAASAP